VADEKGALEIRLERTELSRVELISFDLGTLVAYVNQGAASKDVLDAVREAARLNGEIQATKRSIANLDDEVKRISDDQARVRQNMNSVDRSSQLYTRYVTKLSEQETRLEQIATERDGLQKQQVEQEKALRDYLKGLNVS
jgi:chromosome segregation ATPase